VGTPTFTWEGNEPEPHEQAATGGSISLARVKSDGLQLSDYVLSGASWATKILTFSFTDAVSDYGYNDYTNAAGVNQFAPLNAAQKGAALYALKLVSQYTGVTFTELTGANDRNADLRLAVGGEPNTAWAYYPSSAEQGGDVWFNPRDYNAPVIGNYAWSTFMHELGHAMGLKHGQETSFAGALPTAYNSHEYSLMTYMSYVGSSGSFYTNASDGGPQTYMQADIGALQTLYGANFAFNNTASTYTFSTTTGETFINGVGQGDPNGNTIFRTVWDGGGLDTYDFSNFTTTLKVNLEPGEYSDLAAGRTVYHAYLGGSSNDLNAGYARGNVYNAALYQGDLRSLIVGQRLQNVYDLSSKCFLLKFVEPGRPRRLLLVESGVRLHCTRYSRDKPTMPGNFAMKLRKHLRGRRCTAAALVGLDRVVRLSFGDGEAAHHLIVELYDRGNVILTDAAYTILSLLRQYTLEVGIAPGPPGAAADAERTARARSRRLPSLSARP
jgi:hypothetical protein